MAPRVSSDSPRAPTVLLRSASLQSTHHRSAMASKALQIPKVDFSGLLPGDTAGWDAMQADVLQALETYGCFEVLYDRVSPDLRNALFCGAMPDLFSLPTEIKKRNTYSDMPYQGYLSRMPEFAYESLLVREGDAEGFTRLMWPNGNPDFCDTVSAYANHLKGLEQMIERMIFRSLGVEKYYESHVESLEYGVRLAEYGIPLDQESKNALKAHFDLDLATIICQHQVEGLEVQTKEGEWIPVVPSPNSFTFVIGEAFEAWSNGRLSAVFHRVRIHGNQKRYSVVFNSRPKDGYLIKAPKELIDEEHPLVYEPYTFDDRIKYRISGGGGLKDFCGVRGE